MAPVDPTYRYPPPSAGLIAGYAILAAASLLCAARAAQLGATRSHYGHIYTVRFLFPISCLVMALENATLASSGRFYDPGGSIHVSQSQRNFLYFVFACVSLVVPILLLTTFELTYLVHKRRSVNFCGMFFDEGQRIRRMITTPIKSFVLRNSIRVLAIFLTAVGIIANFSLIRDNTTGEVDDEEGTDVEPADPRCSWVCLFRDERSWDEKTNTLLSLIPTGVLILCNAYFSFLLWRYGTEFSIVVHASILNPWFSLSLGNGALAATQIFGYPPYFPCTSNLGLIIFIISILLLMVEVDKDMVAADQFADFLAQVAKKGDRISAIPRKKQVLQVQAGTAPADGATSSGKVDEVTTPEGDLEQDSRPLSPVTDPSLGTVEKDTAGHTSTGTEVGDVPRTIGSSTDIELGPSTSIDDDSLRHVNSVQGGEVASK